MLEIHHSNPQTVAPYDVATIALAQTTIDFAAYALVDPEVINALCQAAGRGVKIRLYLDRTELEAEARGDVTMGHMPLRAIVNAAGVQTLVKASSILMHLKSYLIDGSVLRDGSANFSPAGEEQQDNSIILTDNPVLCAAFAAKFASMWARPDNLSTAEAIASTGQHSHTPPHRR